MNTDTIKSIGADMAAGRKRSFEQEMQALETTYNALSPLSYEERQKVVACLSILMGIDLKGAAKLRLEVTSNE